MNKEDVLTSTMPSKENVPLDQSKDTVQEEIQTIHVPTAPSKAEIRSAKFGYFGYFFGTGAIFAYFGVIFTSVGLSSRHIGLLVASIPLFSVFLLPVVTYLVDRFRCLRSFLVVCAIGTTLSSVIFLSTPTYPILLTAFIALVAFQAPLNPLFDQHVLSMLPKETRLDSWGALRSLGAYGWGIGNPFAAWIVEWKGSWSIASIQYAFGQLALLYCIFTTKPYEKLERTPMRFHEVFQFVLGHHRLLLFLLASCLMGMGYSFINTFLFIFLESLGGSKLLMGLSLTLTVSTEIPIFKCSKVLGRWFTDRQMLSISMFIWSGRVLGYSFLKNPWMVLFLEPLHGVTFALMWLPGVHTVNNTFPSHLSNSATGFHYMFVAGIGPIIGNIIAGNLYQMLGPRMLFRTASIGMMCGLVLFQVIDRILERREVVVTAVEGLTDTKAEMKVECARCEVPEETLEFTM
ncbi:MFS transporter, PPP family, 3-phenylpropionic acid transporter [Trypanosoma theileri]|uniref:MFS transporter, PPP family, 3-phenylpropionic acid transporter n=1 Tax=Trypanosoma theileri TaxID=67003 RepID=A0A1X0P0X3_9TRYP|nr:MFS transporter, PPP family, 3-phenylpropionic acid transporter [Trypanosoma theileri]ORC90584.1 MFS transporter, PPP family, 3-phenylpropionic acid transporter [Trypanosoma theileri]